MFIVDNLLFFYFIGTLVAIHVLRGRAGIPFYSFLNFEVFIYNYRWYFEVIFKSLLWPYFWHAWVKKGKPESIWKTEVKNNIIHMVKVSDKKKEIHGSF